MPARCSEPADTPAMRVLAISSAYGGCLASLAGHYGSVDAEIGLAACLPAMIAQLLLQAGEPPEMVAVVVGPGSFTGLRAGMSVAAGIGLALDVPVVGVTVSEALAAGLPDRGGRTLWTAVIARTGRVFIDQGRGFAGWQTDALPMSAAPVAVCGNAADIVAAGLAARGGDALVLQACRPAADDVALAARRRLAGALPPLDLQALYVDAPEARLPAGGLRAAPV